MNSNGPPEMTPETAPEAPFRLVKWYLDGVSDGGDVFIAYVAEVRLFGLVIHYASTLVQRKGRPTVTRSSLRHAPTPLLVGSHLRWRSEALGASFAFASECTPLGRTLLENEDGRVLWRCPMPRAKTEITLDDDEPIRGMGYAEQLTLTLPPWRLPIQVLRWGRFVSAKRSLVWIDWRGPHEVQVALLDETPLGPVRVDDDGLVGLNDPVRLSFSETRVLREGAIGRTALSILPAVETLLPARILFTEERKWVSRGVLVCGDERHDGWVIHEVVRWP